MVRLVFLHLDHDGHVALARGGLGVVGGLRYGVEGGVGVLVGVSEEGAVVASRGEDRDVVTGRERECMGSWVLRVTQDLYFKMSLGQF